MPFDDDAEDHKPQFRPPPHPDDRLWRHPSELGDHAIRPPRSPLTPADAQRSGRPWGVMVAAGTAGAVLAGAGVVAFGIGERVINRPVVERVVLDQVASSPGVTDESTIEGLRQRVAPAVVAVESPATAEAGATSDVANAGSGVVVRNDGIVLTSAALVAVGTPVVVRLSNGSSVDAEVLGVDEPTGLGVLDLAGDGYATGVLATEPELEWGETSFTVGAGVAGGTSTAAGVIGVARRYRTASNTVLDGVVEVTGDAPDLALGGPLVDRRGAVIGVVTAVHEGTTSYVAPVDVARKVSDDVLASGHVRHCWLGIEGRDADAAEVDTLTTEATVSTETTVSTTPSTSTDPTAAPATTGPTDTTDSTATTGPTATPTTDTTAPTTTTTAARGDAAVSEEAIDTGEATDDSSGQGVVVATVVPDGPADRSGLEVGDILVELDRRQIGHMPDLVLALRTHSPGDRVDVTVIRDRGRTTLVVTLGEGA